MKSLKIFQFIFIFIACGTAFSYGQAFNIPIAGGTTGPNSPVPITVDGTTLTGVYIGKGLFKSTTSSAFGAGALASTVSSNSNTAIGYASSSAINSGGGSNTTVGAYALQSSTSGANNSVLGGTAMRNWTSGNWNTAVGAQAMYGVTTGGGSAGNYNCSFGATTLFNLYSGSDNCAIGGDCLILLQNGSSNSAFGRGALNHLTGVGTHSSNVAIGASALSLLQAGSSNIGIGPSAQAPITPTGISNSLSIQNVIYGVNMTSATAASTSIGVTGGPTPYYGTTYSKLHIGGSPSPLMPSLQLDYVPDGTNSSGKYLYVDQFTGIVSQDNLPGGNAWLTIGNSGTVDGSNWIGTNDGVPFNIQVGSGVRAGRIDATKMNSFYGSLSGNNATTGTINTAIGYSALSAVTGNNNTAVGGYALNANGAGADNVAVGNEAAKLNDDGYDNVAIGYQALQSNADGPKNVAVGTRALNLTVGDPLAEEGFDNTAVGFEALASNTIGYNNTGLGSFADVADPDLHNATAIGYAALVTANNTIQLGDLNVEQVIAGNAISATNTHLITGKLQVRHAPYVNYVLTCTDATTGEAEWRAPSGGCTCREEMDQQLSEQAKTIEELKKELAALKALVMNGTGANEEGSIKLTQSNVDAKLFQNSPNPFNQSTVIKYSIPSTAKKAVLTVTSISGVKIKEFDLKNKANQVEISGGQLSAGTYVYSLIVDDTFVDAKQMILTR